MIKNKIILAVDDNQTDLVIMHSILQPDYDVRVTRSAAEAFDLLKNFDVDLILLDIEMPDVSGFEFLHEIKKMPKYMNLPVIITSGYSSNECVTHSKTLGALDFVGKPFKAEELRKTITSALNNQQASGVLSRLHSASAL